MCHDMTFAGMSGKVRPYGCGLGGGRVNSHRLLMRGHRIPNSKQCARANARYVGQILAWEGPFSLLAFSQCAGFAALKCAGMYYRNHRKKEEIRWYGER